MIDNMMVHHRAWQKKLASLGLDMPIEEVMEKVHGVNTEILANLFGDRFTHEERVQIASEKEVAYREIYLAELKLIAGLAEFLSELAQANTPMAVASAAPPENVNFVLDHLPLRPYFSAILHSDSVEKGKPHPEIYLKTAAALQQSPEDCVVFEDSPTGAKAAAAAGCAVIVITTTHSEQEFSEIPNICRFIENFEGITVEHILALGLV